MSDYPNLLSTNNVNAIADSKAISEDGSAVAVAGAFQMPAGPRLAAESFNPSPKNASCIPRRFP
jgi:hypothetical protein